MRNGNKGKNATDSGQEELESSEKDNQQTSEE